MASPNLVEKVQGEVDHCRHRLMKYCRGQGLDLGCGMSKIRTDAIGVDLYNPNADTGLDARNLEQYASGHFDYIFSSHLLEEIENTEATLREWLRVLKDNGNIVLYQADKDKYYPLGHPQCNRSHKHHFSWKDLADIFEKIGGTRVIHVEDNFNNEWSFELVVQKTDKALEEDIGEGISILVPTYKRPQSMDDFSKSVDKTSKNPSKVEILFGVNEEDEESIKKCEELRVYCKITINYTLVKNHPNGKVNLSYLWNQMYTKALHPIYGFFGDDVIFWTPGWDEEVRKEFLEDHVKLVSCNDVHIQKGRKAILFFTHKDVHDLIGFYMNDKFYRWFMDSWWDIIFQRLGKLIYREDLICEHLLPYTFKERLDNTFKRMEGLQEADKVVWDSMETLNSIKAAIEKIDKTKVPSDLELGQQIRYLKNS
jgi:predicted SAM-dependent methyltransferase